MTKEEENKKEVKEEVSIDRLKEEAQSFLNDFNDNIPQLTSGMGSFIREDETSDTWFFGDTEDDLALNYALLGMQIAEHLDVNMFDLLLNVQTKLAGVYTDEYIEFTKTLDDIEENLKPKSTKL